ncbi:hypothetical protein GCM10010975_30850 [Comamonas phosphati]|nr:hypothetical protein GCM10010975_30850 [Comamonas phosphati]
MSFLGIACKKIMRTWVPILCMPTDDTSSPFANVSLLNFEAGFVPMRTSQHGMACCAGIEPEQWARGIKTASPRARRAIPAKGYCVAR